MSTLIMKKVTLIICSLLVLQWACQVSGNQINKLYLKDKNGHNLCLGELDCIADPNIWITLDFQLAIVSADSGLLFSITSDVKEKKNRELTNGYTVRACYSHDKGVTLSTSCTPNIIPVGTYHLTYSVFVPEYPDKGVETAYLKIACNKGFSALRNLVQH